MECVTHLMPKSKTYTENCSQSVLTIIEGPKYVTTATCYPRRTKRSLTSWFVILSLTHGAVGLPALCDSSIFGSYLIILL